VYSICVFKSLINGKLKKKIRQFLSVVDLVEERYQFSGGNLLFALRSFEVSNHHQERQSTTSVQHLEKLVADFSRNEG
jgi:hypothetical protein